RHSGVRQPDLRPTFGRVALFFKKTAVQLESFFDVLAALGRHLESEQPKTIWLWRQFRDPIHRLEGDAEDSPGAHLLLDRALAVPLQTERNAHERQQRQRAQHNQGSQGWASSAPFQG